MRCLSGELNLIENDCVLLSRFMQQPAIRIEKRRKFTQDLLSGAFPSEQAVCTERECRDADRIGVHDLFKREFRHFGSHFPTLFSFFLLHTDTLHLWKLGKKRVDCECRQKFATKV